ncbi:MAG TPA: MerR family transcriptional regulator [Streptosporangiaceae bacterium]|nr:MerR family transcriptional regulator [Streptosporangiaceae bacterium]
MSAQPARGYLGISDVLAQLRGEFPDISVSKIRFLETEGLISPARSASGYRRFCAADLDRLRYILAAQRDQYLPLRVIKERLTKRDPDGGAAARPLERHPDGDPDRLGPGSGPLSRSELVAAAGLTEALLTELETFGLVRRVGRQYGPDALQVARAAAALAAYGVEARHLRAVRAAAERETALIESLVAPILAQRGRGARDLAARTAAEVAGQVLRLHAALVDAALAEAGLAPGEEGGPPVVAPAGRRPATGTGLATGVAGASA